MASDILVPAEERSQFQKLWDKYYRLSTRNKAATFKCVKVLYEGYVAWNKKYLNNRGSKANYANWLIKEKPDIRENWKTLELKLKTYEELLRLNWKYKRSISFSRYRDILIMNLQDADKIDLLKQLEKRKKKLTARELRELIRSKKMKKSAFGILKDPIVFDNTDNFLNKIRSILAQCPSIPSGTHFHLRLVHKSLKTSLNRVKAPKR